MAMGPEKWAEEFADCDKLNLNLGDDDDDEEEEEFETEEEEEEEESWTLRYTFYQPKSLF